MRIVHYYRDLTRTSGVTAAIEGWQAAAGLAGLRSIALHNGANELIWRLPNAVVPHRGRGRQGQVPLLDDFLESGDVLMLHEGWVTSNYVAAATAHRRGIPYIVMPHGVYEPAIRRELKFPRTARLVAEKSYLRHSRAVHVFYSSEAALACRVSPSLKTFALPTGFDPSPGEWVGDGEYYAWFGRYAVDHKGIDRMLYAYAMIPPSKRIPLRMRGIDYHSGKAATLKLIASLDLQKWVSVGGPLDSAEKTSFLSHCNAFLFPSRWESQGISLVEALAIGVPSLASDSIHIAQSLSEAAAASVVSFSDFTTASSAMLRILDSQVLSSAAHDYVRRELSWTKIAGAYAEKLVIGT